MTRLIASEFEKVQRLIDVYHIKKAEISEKQTKLGNLSKKENNESIKLSFLYNKSDFLLNVMKPALSFDDEASKNNILFSKIFVCLSMEKEFTTYI